MILPIVKTSTVVILILLTGCNTLVERSVPSPVPHTSGSGDESTDGLNKQPGATVAKSIDYRVLFAYIREMVSTLDRIIEARDFTAWQTHLSEEYVNTFSDREVLKRLSGKPKLRELGIQLRSLRDYFNYVVVPSRRESRLDDLFFDDDGAVRAIMIIDGQPTTLYRLRKIDGTWKIVV